MENRLFSWTVILLPILMQYSIGVKGITLGEICIVISAMLIWINKRTNIVFSKEQKSFCIFVLLTYALSILSFLYQGNFSFETLTRMIRYGFYFTVIFSCSSNFDVPYIYKAYKIICVVISIYMIFQKIFFELFTIILTNKILPFEWYASAPGVDELKKNYIQYFFQARGIFTEPGFVIHYFFPCMILILFNKNEKKKKWLWLVIMLTALWLTKSVQAYVLGSGIIAFYFLRGFGSKKIRLLRNSLILLIPIVLTGILILQTPSGKLLFGKVVNTFFLGGSVSVRLGRGYAIYGALPIVLKLTGVGIGNLDSFVLENSIRTIFDPAVITENLAGYVNGMSSIFLYGGVAGLIFLYSLTLCYKHGKCEKKFLVIFYVILMLGEGVVFSTTGLFLLMFIFSNDICKTREIIK